MQPHNVAHDAEHSQGIEFANYGAAAHAKPRASGGGMPTPQMLVLAIFLPWFMFCFMMSMESFTAHFYCDTALTPLLFLGGLAVVLLLALPAVRALTSGDTRGACWQGLLTVLTLLALLLGIILGGKNYEDNMRPYYDIKNSNEYHTVDPALYTGNQMMDAGRIEFAEGTYVDVGRSMTFRNHEIYCVAPIVSGNASAVPETYDFWAVGTNCCSGHSKTFHCGEYNMVGARSGLRLMNDNLRPFFRLAVQQAEAAFSMPANHPIFFYWMKDAIYEVQAYENAGYQKFMQSSSQCLFVLFVGVIAGAVVYSKI